MMYRRDALLLVDRLKRRTRDPDVLTLCDYVHGTDVHGTIPASVIPLREGTTGHAPHDAEKYRWRHLVENFFCSLKAFRRIATRYEKTDKCFAAMINVVAVVLWTR